MNELSLRNGLYSFHRSIPKPGISSVKLELQPVTNTAAESQRSIVGSHSNVSKSFQEHSASIIVKPMVGIEVG